MQLFLNLVDLFCCVSWIIVLMPAYEHNDTVPHDVETSPLLFDQPSHFLAKAHFLWVEEEEEFFMIEEEEVCWHTFKRVTKLESDLNKLEENSMHRQLTEQEKLERKQLHDSLWVAAQAHQSLLRQKSRWRWLKEGDCNTGYSMDECSPRI